MGVVVVEREGRHRSLGAERDGHLGPKEEGWTERRRKGRRQGRESWRRRSE